MTMTGKMTITPRTEADEFQRARQLIDRRTDVSGGIEAMLNLAWEARNPKIREWATQYMQSRLGVTVGVMDDEAQAKAG